MTGNKRELEFSSSNKAPTQAAGATSAKDAASTEAQGSTHT